MLAQRDEELKRVGKYNPNSSAGPSSYDTPIQPYWNTNSIFDQPVDSGRANFFDSAFEGFATASSANSAPAQEGRAGGDKPYRSAYQIIQEYQARDHDEVMGNAEGVAKAQAKVRVANPFLPQHPLSTSGKKNSHLLITHPSHYRRKKQTQRKQHKLSARKTWQLSTPSTTDSTKTTSKS